MLFSTLVSLWSWAVLPDLLTHHLLTLSYQTFHITPAPRRNTPTYRRHHTLLFSFLVSSWLCYDLVRFFTKQGEGGYGSFYEMLGVGVDVDENGLKAGFRQVVKKIHPDRNSYLADDQNNVQVEVFVRVRQVYEALRNPNVRFAYDRFGPGVLSWTSCHSRRDFMVHGILQAGGYHIVSGGTLLIWSLLSKSNFVSFWRWILFCLFLFTEFILLFSSSSSFWIIHLLTWISPPNRVIYHHVLFLRHLFPILNIVLGRLVPLFFPFSQNLDQRIEKAFMEKTRTLINLADRQASITLHTDLHAVTTTTHPRTISPLPSPTLTSLYQSRSNHLLDLIIEHHLKLKTTPSSLGPLRTIWEKHEKKLNVPVPST